MTKKRTPQVGDEVVTVFRRMAPAEYLQRIAKISDTGQITLENGTRWKGMGGKMVGAGKDPWPAKIYFADDADRAATTKRVATQALRDVDPRAPDALAKLTKIMEVLGE